jgi:hypothetical protein
MAKKKAKKKGPTSAQLKVAVDGLTQHLDKLKKLDRKTHDAIRGHLNVIAHYCRAVFTFDRGW